ncbi:MAG: hypothetical protein EOO22_08115 [Comamonadaceae bacterium]|nr:MAG: hypothetical protein EOO22_08115 [Comamonadaceae bacterium]
MPRLFSRPSSASKTRCTLASMPRRPDRMAWLIRCLYRPGGSKDRLPLRPAHIRHMLDWLPKTVFGAAMLDTEGYEPIGMVVVLNVASRFEADGFIEAEPYRLAGLFSRVEVTPLVQMTPPYGTEFLLGQLQQSGQGFHE